MPTLLTKALTIPTIEVSHLTCLGMQYIVADPDYYRVVTATNTSLTCSCGTSMCIHIQAVQHQQAHNVEVGTHCDAHEALFDLASIE